MGEGFYSHFGVKRKHRKGTRTDEYIVYNVGDETGRFITQLRPVMFKEIKQRSRCTA